MANNAAQGRSQGSSAGRWSLIGGGALAAALLAFIVQNRESVSFTWLFWTFNAPLWIVLVLTALVAFLIGQFALMWRRHRRRQARRDAR
jgi:uncharacterized integral membrane protein